MRLTGFQRGGNGKCWDRGRGAVERQGRIDGARRLEVQAVVDCNARHRSAEGVAWIGNKSSTDR